MLISTCSRKGCETPLSGRQTKYCSRRCQVNVAVAAQRRKNKRRLTDHFGGQCVLCGYNRCQDALEFHHKDESVKEFGISVTGKTYGMDRMIAEAEKCLLVCANCHREIHAEIRLV